MPGFLACLRFRGHDYLEKLIESNQRLLGKANTELTILDVGGIFNVDARLWRDRELQDHAGFVLEHVNLGSVLEYCADFDVFIFTHIGPRRSISLSIGTQLGIPVSRRTSASRNANG